MNNVAPEVVQRNWAGEGDILEIVKRLMCAADKMVGKGMFLKLTKVFKS